MRELLQLRQLGVPRQCGRGRSHALRTAAGRLALRRRILSGRVQLRLRLRLPDPDCTGTTPGYCSNCPEGSCANFNCVNLLPNDNAHCANEPPASWTCQFDFYGDGLCDCGCGAVDLDCESRPARAVTSAIRRRLLGHGLPGHHQRGQQRGLRRLTTAAERMPRPSSSFKRAPGPADRRGHVLVQDYLGVRERAEILSWLETLRPIWEFRYSTTRPTPRGEAQRRLLRPVYWLGNWQFACLDYYRPPHGVHERAVAAEPFPRVLTGIVADIERRARQAFPREHVPERWYLNTCLVNFYGDRREGERWVDCARVGGIATSSRAPWLPFRSGSGRCFSSWRGARAKSDHRRCSHNGSTTARCNCLRGRSSRTACCIGSSAWTIAPASRCPPPSKIFARGASTSPFATCRAST